MSRYLEVRKALVDELASGAFGVGDRFPTDFELCARFGVSRSTVREALRSLQDEGVLVRQRGAGTVVAGPPRKAYVQTIDSLGELGVYAADAPLEETGEEIVAANPALAEVLGCTVGARWLCISGLRRLREDGAPLCWTEIYIAEPYVHLQAQLHEGDAPYFEKIERLTGVAIHEVEQQISAIGVPADIARRMGCEVGSPGILTRRRYFDRDGAFFQGSVSIYPAGRYVYTARLSSRQGK